MHSTKSTFIALESGPDTLHPPDARRVWSATARVRGDVLRHDHDYFEIAVVAGGTARHRTLYDQTPLAARHVLFLPPGTWHAYADARRLVVHNWGFRPALLRRELAWLIDRPRFAALLWPRLVGSRPPPACLGRLGPDAMRDAVRLSTRAQTLGPAQHVAAVAALLDLLHLCTQTFGDLLDRRVNRPPHRAVVAASAILLERYAEAWTLPGLARAVHVEPSYLTRLFSRSTGRPPMAYLNHLRLERAASLLLRTDLPIGVVGQRVGLDDPNHFARRFRQHFKQSPSAFRAAEGRPA
ncbi:MAG: AraC family transcriptional regulator [Planctomycetota bacterium]